MNIYDYGWKELDAARKEMEIGQPFVINVHGWRSGPAYRLMKHFAAVENRNGGFGSALISSFFGFLLPGLALISAQSRLSGYALTFTRDAKGTHITLHPAKDEFRK